MNSREFEQYQEALANPVVIDREEIVIREREQREKSNAIIYGTEKQKMIEAMNKEASEKVKPFECRPVPKLPISKSWLGNSRRKKEL